MRSFVILALLCGVAVAQTPPADPAEVAYQEGKRLYDLREWDQAIAKFKEAYKLRADAASLFNIAQSYRLKNDCAEAYAFYKTFKQKFPQEKNVAKAEKFMTELEECAKKGAEKPTEPVKTEPTTTTTTEPAKTEPAKTEPAITETKPTERPPPPVEHKPGGGLRLAGLVVGGIGVAALGTGIYFGVQASSRADELTNSPVWDQHLYDSGQSADRNSKILIGVGTAAIAGGVVMYILGRKAATESASVSVTPTRGGAALVWSCEL